MSHGNHCTHVPTFAVTNVDRDPITGRLSGTVACDECGMSRRITEAPSPESLHDGAHDWASQHTEGISIRMPEGLLE